MRQWAGVVVKDLPRYLRLLSPRDSPAYLQVRNRDERLIPAPEGPGFRCDWRWSSELHAPKFLPALGRWLMARSLRDHPIEMAVTSPWAEAPDVSFIIGHRGESRLPHLLATLASLAGQRNARLECLVVEQDAESTLRAHLPSWVRHVHTPPPQPQMPYCRSWAFNVGAQQARGRILVLHDNDMLAPQDYAACLLSHFEKGVDVANLTRFIFYLDDAQTGALFALRDRVPALTPAVITQNVEGGGTVAISREAFARIGGMDESFVGWGGEDNEFWERAQTLRHWSYGYLPMVHLHHAAQPGKQNPRNQTAIHYELLSRVSPAERIARLRSAPRGAMAGPQGWPPTS